MERGKRCGCGFGCRGQWVAGDRGRCGAERPERLDEKGPATVVGLHGGFSETDVTASLFASRNSQGLGGSRSFVDNVKRRQRRQSRPTKDRQSPHPNGYT